MELSLVPIEWLVYRDTLELCFRRDEREYYYGKENLIRNEQSEI
jgi:hypothetical protein